MKQCFQSFYSVTIESSSQVWLFNPPTALYPSFQLHWWPQQVEGSLLKSLLILIRKSPFFVGHASSILVWLTSGFTLMLSFRLLAYVFISTTFINIVDSLEIFLIIQERCPSLTWRIFIFGSAFSFFSSYTSITSGLFGLLISFLGASSSFALNSKIIFDSLSKPTLTKGRSD